MHKNIIIIFDNQIEFITKGKPLQLKSKTKLSNY